MTLRTISPLRSLLLGLAFFAWSAVLAPPEARADFGSGQLLIAGSRLVISPVSQTVPFDTPTIVNTELVGFDASAGSLPPDLRVVGDLSGPEIDGILPLETTPGEPFEIPRFAVGGQYQLDDIRLMQGEELLAYAEPRSAAILVTQVLIARVTSRPLTLDEINARGIVVDNSNLRAFSFTFGFLVEGEVVDYNIDALVGYDEAVFLTPTSPNDGDGGGVRFSPPPMTPFTLKLDPLPDERPEEGGCGGNCSGERIPPIPGILVFPTDVSLLNQFFSVVLMVQNGAPAGDALVLRDLTGNIKLPPGLRPARTNPPTVLGTPVPVRHPGLDGELGTGDDLTFLIAQSVGEAEFLVEGVKEGTHLVDIDIEGVLEGLPTGIRHISGRARGAVVVRDPTLGVTVTHPEVVREGEEYDLLLTVSNTSASPANLINFTIPRNAVTGAEIVGSNSKTIDSLPPGESDLISFRVRALRTGRVSAIAARASNVITPRFELTLGVGENGIPLSPTAILLPHETKSLPPILRDNALRLLGLGFSLATAPPSLVRGLPRVGRRSVDRRVFQLGQAGHFLSFGEEPFDVGAVLLAEWLGVRDHDWDWDRLRRSTQKGALFGDSIAQMLAPYADAQGADAAFERFLQTTAYLPPMMAAIGTGDGTRLEVESRTSGKRLAAPGLDATRVRDLPYGDLLDLGGSQMAVMADPEVNGYRVSVRRAGGGLVDLALAVPQADGSPRRVRFPEFTLGPSGVAFVEAAPGQTSFTLQVDSNGDGRVDDQLPGSVAAITPRPFEAVVARLNSELDPSAHVVDVLFTADVNLAELLPADPRRFEIPGKLSNGGVASNEGFGVFVGASTHSRILRVVFNNPISPYVAQILTLRDLDSTEGEHLSQQTLTVETDAPGLDPGTIVDGQVIGTDGEPAAGSVVELYETDFCSACLVPRCIEHKTGAVRADAQGKFTFDYVRQTVCSDLFRLVAAEPATERKGEARGRVRFIGQRVKLDVVMLGRGKIRGKITYEDGTVPAAPFLVAMNPAFNDSRGAIFDGQGNYTVGDLAVGTIAISVTDRLGNFAYATVQIPTSGAVVERDLVIIRRPELGKGDLRGRVLDADGVTLIEGAEVALYQGQRFLGVRTSDRDGRFLFEMIPEGPAEIEAFSGETGRAGANFFFEILPDRVNEIDVLLRDERGVVEGTVYTQSLTGTRTPLEGAVVYVLGTPFNTTTDAQGHYRLESIIAGNWRVVAANLTTQREVTVTVSVPPDGSTVIRDLVFQESVGTKGTIRGQVLGLSGLPVSGATVHLRSGAYTWIYQETSDANGEFTIADVDLGTYEVHAIRGSDGGTATASVQFPGQVATTTIRFGRGTIRGTVKLRNANGSLTPLPGSVIRYQATGVFFGLVALDPDSHDLRVDAEGRFEIPSLVGRYILIALNPFYGDQQVLGEIFANGEVTNHDIEFDAETTGEIHGRVVDFDGVTPVPDARVTLRHPQLQDVYDVTTDALGQFQMRLIPPHGERLPIEVVAERGAVFRRSQIWVELTRPGQELDVEIVLPKQGGVAGWVEDADGQRVVAAEVKLRESRFPYRTIVRDTDQEGRFRFDNVFPGVASITAFEAARQIGGKATVEITSEDQQIEGVVVRLQPIGKIHGVITSPVDGSPVRSAVVDLLRNGALFDSINSDEQGAFEFVALPLATYEVRAFDPRSGRAARASNLRITSNGQVLDVSIVLQARGDVAGKITDPQNGGSPVAGSVVRLATNNALAGFTTYSSTDATGAYEFRGIPQGTFTLAAREPAGRRQAMANGEIRSEGERVVIDLALERSGSIFGRVLSPALGSNELFDRPVNVQLYQVGAGLIDATLDNPYRVDGILAGLRYELVMEEQGGPHRFSLVGTLANEGEQIELDIRPWAIGGLRVRVLDGAGNPVSGAEVNASSASPYRGFFTATSDANGEVLFPRVGAGQVSAYALDPATGLRGSGTAEVRFEGHVPLLIFQLEPVGSVVGRVLLPDGVSPAVNALIRAHVSIRDYYARTSEDGRFEFPALPLGSVELLITEESGTGLTKARASLTTSGQRVDLGDLVLDDLDPFVVESNLASGAIDVPIGQSFVIRFSERMDTRVGFGSVAPVGSFNSLIVDHVWSEGDTVVTIKPRAPLASFSSYRLRLEGFTDLLGRRLNPIFQIAFTTADQTPPIVVETSPTPAAFDVPLDAQVRVRFSEPVVLASLSGTAIQLTDETAGAGVGTTFLLQPGEREVLITPVGGLVAEHRYRMTIQGVRDLKGNVLAAPYSWIFDSLDVTAPTIGVTTPRDGAVLTSGVAVNVTAEVLDAHADRVILFFAGRTYVDQVAPYRWSLIAPPVSETTDFTMTVQAFDDADNHTEKSWTVRVVPSNDTSNPQISVLCPSNSAILAPGTSQRIQIQASDNEAVEKVEIFVDGGATPVASLLSAPYEYTFSIPDDAAAGRVYQVRAVATDFTGRSAEQTVPIEVRHGVVFTTAVDIAASDVGLTNQSVFVAAGGNLRIFGPHTFKDLIVLEGGKVRHENASLATFTTEGLRLQITGDVYVACGGAIDVSGRGLSTGYDFGVCRSTGFEQGASHGGRGSTHAITSCTYDSVFDPSLPGAAGGYKYCSGSFCDPTDGGGLVRLRAAGTMVLDGDVLANAASLPAGSFTNWSAGGAGGSIRLDAVSIIGRGRIEANGESSENLIGRPKIGGGGGRIALYAGAIDDGLIARTRAIGGTTGGGPGTIFLQRGSQEHGDLVVDNAGRTTDPLQLAELPSIGRGVLETVGVDSITDDQANWSPWLQGVWVAIGDDPENLWRVTASTEHTLTLDVANRPLTALAGDTYRGVYRFDQTIVRGLARLGTNDAIRSTTPIQVAAGAELLHDNAGGPSIAVGFDPATSVDAGEFLAVESNLADPEGLMHFEIRATGARVETRPTFLSSAPTSRLDVQSFVIPSPPAADHFDVVVEAIDRLGLKTVSSQHSIPVVADGTPPTINITRPNAGQVFIAGATIQVDTHIFDSQGSVPSATLRWNGVDYPKVPFITGSFSWTLIAPPVTFATDLPIVITAADSSGNVATVTRTVRVNPVINPDAPEVSLCPGPGAKAIAGRAVSIRMTATDANGIERVEFFHGDEATPVAVVRTATSGTYRYDFPVPVFAAVGEVFRVRAVAYDFGGNSAGAESSFTIVTGLVISTATHVEPTDQGLSGVPVIVAGVDLSFDGFHELGSLVVLDGGRVRNVTPNGNELQTHLVDLQVAGDVYVACGGTFDVKSQGYAAGRTFPEVTYTTGAPTSHGGRGGSYTAIQTPFGSLWNPREPGAGSFSNHSGGGAVSIVSGGAVVIDGRIDVGTFQTSGTNAGPGSIHLEGSALSGLGTLWAAGANGGEFTPSGGRIALVGDSVDEGLIARSFAHGGRAFSNSFCFGDRCGGAAGTLYVKRAGQSFGDLILDNDGNLTQEKIDVTELLPIGQGTIDSLTVDSITDDQAAFPYGLAGAYVALNGDTSKLWKIVSNDHLGKTLRLDVSSEPLTAQVGDSYRGVYRFDNVILQGNAHLMTRDLLSTTTPPVVGAGSTVRSDHTTPPTAELVAPASVRPESTFEFTASAQASAGLMTAGVVVTGAQPLFQYGTDRLRGGTTWTETQQFRVPVPPTHPEITLRLTTVDAFGLETTIERTIAIEADTAPPTVISFSPADQASATSGETVTFTADLSDDIRVASATFTFNGQSSTDTTAPYTWSATVPGVSTPTDYPFTLRALDSAGNATEVTRTLRVVPLANVGIPLVHFACPSVGAKLPAGAHVDARIVATDDDGIERLDVYVGNATTPTATLTGPTYTYRLTVPANALAGDVVRLRAVATDFAGNAGEATVEIPVVSGTVVTNLTLSPTDTSLEGATVIVAHNGTLVVEGRHAFGDLFVLDGGRVFGKSWSAGQPEPILDLEVERTLWVSCGAQISQTNRGYQGGSCPSFGTFVPGYSIGGDRTDGAINNGASHGGLGGDYRGGGLVYGSLFDPSTLGSGGPCFGRGGGAMRLSAGTLMAIDGSVHANAEQDAAGGSIRLVSPQILGGGTVEARGADSVNDSIGVGGGGRIAIYGGSIDDGLLARTTAQGGRRASNPFFTTAAVSGGAAGTVFVRREGQAFGELIVDNRGSSTRLATPLVTIGTGTIDLVGAASISDNEASFVAGLAGGEVVLRGDSSSVWKIVGNAHRGQKIDLDVTDNPLLATVGDSYQGRYRFDRVIVRGGANLAALDPIVSTQPIELGSGSVLDNDRPTAALAVTPTETVSPGQTFEVTLTGTDGGLGLRLLDLQVTGPVNGSNSAAPISQLSGTTTEQLTVPAQPSSSSFTVVGKVIDLAGFVTTVTRTIVIAGDVTPPEIRAVAPAEGSAWTAGDAVAITADVFDAVAVSRVTFRFGDGRTFVDTQAPWGWDTFAPAVSGGAPSDVPIVIDAVDSSGNTSQFVRTVRIAPLADAVAPSLSYGCPTPGALLAPGRGMDVTFNANDDVRLDRVDFYLNGSSTPNAIVYSAPFTVRLDAPPTAQEGDLLTVRAVAHDFGGSGGSGGNVAELTLTVRVVTGVLLTTSTTIDATNLSFEGQTLIVDDENATLTLAGPHRFRDLLVLRGNVTHPFTSATEVHRLDLQLDRDLFVGCGGTLNTIGRGFRGGTSANRTGISIGNTTAEGAPETFGGTHGGGGGGSTDRDDNVYDSWADPTEPGGGGGAVRRSSTVTDAGGAGGGVVRINAAGKLVIDGQIAVGGDASNAAAGAGGSIALFGDVISGAGLISADGGNTFSTGANGGGGGRIALVGNTVDPTLVARSTARGGERTGTFVAPQNNGAAGTIYVRRAGQSFGELIVDNLGLRTNHTTVLLSVGRGTVTALNSTQMTGDGDLFRYRLMGSWVAFNDDFSALWPIVTNAHKTSTLTLDVAGRPLTASIGDLYSGALRLDTLVVRGGSKAQVDDRALIANLSVAPDSQWFPGNDQAPLVDASKFRFEFGPFGLLLVGSAGAVVDPDEPLQITVENLTSGYTYDLSGILSTEEFRLSLAGQAGDLFRIVATDGHRLPRSSAPVDIGPLTGDYPAATEFDLSYEPTFFEVKDRTMTSVRTLCENSGGGGAFLAPNYEAVELELFHFDLADPNNPSEIAYLALPPGQPCVTDAAKEGGALVLARGNAFDVLDVSDRTAPFYDEATQHLVIWPPPEDPNEAPAETRVVLGGGRAYLFTLENPARYAVIDITNLRSPSLLATGTLPVASALDGVVIGRELWLLTNDFQGIPFETAITQNEIRVFDLSDPTVPVLVKESETPGASTQTHIWRIEDVLFFGYYDDETGGLGSFHRTQANHSAATRSLFGFGADELEEVGDVLLAAFGAPAITVGTRDLSAANHGATESVVYPLPSTVSTIDVGAERIWTQSGGRVVGYPSTLVMPWIEASKVTLTKTGIGARFVGSAGAVVPPIEAVASGGTVELRVRRVNGTSDLATANVAVDGSFTLDVPDVAVGDRLELRAHDVALAGNLIRWTVPTESGLVRGRR